MNMVDLKKVLNYLKFEISIELDDFVEFHGKMKNQNGKVFDIEGSFGIDDEKNISYSLNYYDTEKKCEYDGMIGRIFQPNNNDIISLIAPNFVEI